MDNCCFHICTVHIIQYQKPWSTTITTTSTTSSVDQSVIALNQWQRIEITKATFIILLKHYCYYYSDLGVWNARFTLRLWRAQTRTHIHSFLFFFLICEISKNEQNKWNRLRFSSVFSYITRSITVKVKVGMRCAYSVLETGCWYFDHT